MSKEKITIQATVHAPIDYVWTTWTQPEHVTNWNAASDDWYCPRATSDFKEGGKFNYRMESVDGRAGFDFTGAFDEIIPFRKIAYTMDDHRTVVTTFEATDSKVDITSTFEAEDQNSLDLQRYGWQAILDRYKEYTERTLEDD